MFVFKKMRRFNYSLGWGCQELGCREFERWYRRSWARTGERLRIWIEVWWCERWQIVDQATVIQGISFVSTWLGGCELLLQLNNIEDGLGDGRRFEFFFSWRICNVMNTTILAFQPLRILGLSINNWQRTTGVSPWVSTKKPVMLPVKRSLDLDMIKKRVELWLMRATFIWF